jgi:hypothetical protein
MAISAKADAMNAKPTDYVYVPVPVRLVQEIYERCDLTAGHVNIAGYVEDVLKNFLDSTAGNADIWKNEHYLQAYWENRDFEERLQKYGPRNEGFQWKNLFLPNGTRLRMTYKGTVHEAEVRHRQIVHDGETEYEGSPLSPSLLVRKIAGDTNRNAWRDLYILRPGERDWVLADVARKT